MSANKCPRVPRTQPRLSTDLCTYALGPFLTEYDCETARRALILDCNRSVLDFSVCDDHAITDAFLQGYALPRRAHTIILTGCTRFTHTGLLHLLRCCPDVTTLDVSR
jgi:hypothetical protein